MLLLFYLLPAIFKHYYMVYDYWGGCQCGGYMSRGWYDMR